MESVRTELTFFDVTPSPARSPESYRYTVYGVLLV